MSNSDIPTQAPDRDINYVDSEHEEYMEISLTGKEAIDMYNALDMLVEQVNSDRFQTDLPVIQMRDMFLGGVHFPSKVFTVTVHSQDYARVLMHALVNYLFGSERILSFTTGVNPNRRVSGWCVLL